MGGGGVFGGDYTPDRYKRIIDETREKTQDIAFETTVGTMIADILAETERDAESTREHLDEIQDTIGEEDIGAIETRFGGSVKRHTYVDGLSDVDVLLILDKTELADASPHEALEYVQEVLSDANLRDVADIRVGDLAVTVRFTDDEEIQLLPAVRKGEGFRIPNARGDEWSNVIRPDQFASKLTEVNQNCNGKVVPTVKLAKGIVSQLPEDQRPSGYHLESIAIEIFKQYPVDDKPTTPKAMLRHLFENAREVVRNPIRDKTNQSMNVDDDLGPSDSLKRKRMGYALDRIGRRMKNADEVGSVEEWVDILGG